MATTPAPKLTDFTTAQLTAAANKYMQSKMDATYTASQLIAMAKSDPALATKIMNFVPGVNAAVAATAAPKIAPDTRTAAQKAADAAAVKLGYKNAADQAAQEKAIADQKAAQQALAAKTQTAAIATAASKLGLSVADYTAAINNLIATNPNYKNQDINTITSRVGAAANPSNTDITTSAKTVAANLAADKAAQAQGYANATAMKEAQNAAANAAALKAAEEKRAAEAKAAADKAAADKAAAEKVATINNAQNAFIQKLNSGSVSAQDIKDYKTAVTNAGGTVQDSLVNRATTALSQTYQNQLVGAKTQEEANNIIQQAKDAGAPINQGYVDQSNAKFSQLAAAQAAQAKVDATNKLNNQLYNQQTGLTQNLTQDQLDSIKQQAKDQGLTLNDAYLQRAQQRIDNVAKDAAWTPPDVKTISTMSSQQSYATTPSGQRLIGLPADPKTGQAAGWYVDTGAGYQKWDKGPSGAVVPYNDFNKQSATVFGDIQQAQTDQKMSDWYKTVSDPAYLKDQTYNSIFDNNVDVNQALQAPDGSYWKYVPGNRDTGQAGTWYTAVPGTGGTQWKSATISASGAQISDKPVSTQQVQQQLVQANTTNRQSFDAENAAKQAAYDAAHPATQTYDYEGELKLSGLDKLALVGLVAAAAAPLLAELGSSAAAALSEGSAAATGLAEAGMTMPEVAATLEASGIPTAAADVMAAQSTSLVSGATSLSSALASSGVSAEALAAANAVAADPMAALIASQGWTAVDTAYLASIGAPAALIATAEATNVAMGLPASEIGTTATAEAAGTAPAGSTAEVAASQPVAPTTPPPGTIDVSNMTQEQLNQALYENNPYLETGPGTQLAEATQAAEEIPYRVDVSGLPGTTETASYVRGPLTEGYELASQQQVDAGLAQWNEAANAWQVPVSELSPVVPVIEAAAGSTPISAIAPGVDLFATAAPAIAAGAAGAAALSSAAPAAAPTPTPTAPTTTTEITTPATSGQPTIPGTETTAPVYDATPTPVTPTPAPPPPPVTPQYPTDIPTEPVNPANPNAPDNIDVGGGYNPAEVPVEDITPTPVENPVTGTAGAPLSATDLAKIAAGWTLVNGILTPPKLPSWPGYGPIPPTQWGTAGQVNVPGTNPGWFTNVPAQYKTTSPVQSKFYWGQHPYQAGETFSPEQYQQVSAPAVPFGLQQMYNPQTETINNLLQGVQQASAVAPYNVPRAPLV